MTKQELKEIARQYVASGLNVLPAIKAQKRPAINWRQYVDHKPAFDSVFDIDNINFDALCVVCGPVSGGLEILDFDQQGAAFNDFVKETRVILEGRNVVIESTQSGGKHIAYRCDNCGRNLKLAASEKGVLIETRGVGGICLISPTDGYNLLTGNWRDVPTIADVERDALIEKAREFDLAHAPSYVPKIPPVPTLPSNNAPLRGGGESVADYLRRAGIWRDRLTANGWKYLFTRGDWEQWQRPNQTAHNKPGGSFQLSEGYFHCFTSNAPPLQMDGTYSPLQLIAALDFNGDESAAARHWTQESRPEFIPNFLGAPLVIDAETKQETQPQEVIESFDAVPFPEQLKDVDGLIGEFARLAIKYAIRPQPEGAFLAGLIAMSFLCGRTTNLSYNGVLTTPNLYGLFLAPSGMGKDVLRRVCRAVVAAYDGQDMAPESFASIQALQNYVTAKRKVLWLHDEFGRDLQVMTGKTTNSNVTGIITETLKLYSSASSRSYIPKLISDEAKGKKEFNPVDRPNLSILATGNPREFYEAANETLLQNGYIARFTIINGRSYSPKKDLNFDDVTTASQFRLSADLIARIQAWYKLEEESTADPFTIPFNKDAFEIIKEFDATIETQIKQDVLTSDFNAEIRARYFEKVWKYALLFAASRYGARADFIVDSYAAEMAVALVNYEANTFAANVKRFNQTPVIQLQNDILYWAKQVKKFSRSQFSRRFQKKERRLREEALANLIDAGYLEANEERLGTGRIVGEYSVVDNL